MCFDCGGVDENIMKKEEERKRQREIEEQERQKKEQEKIQEFSDPRVKAIFKLATELTRLRGNNPVGLGNLCNREVYENSPKNESSCPKCNSPVKIYNETLELNYEYDLMKGFKTLNRPGFMCEQVCFYDIDNSELELSNIEKTCQKKDENGFYLAINGNKYPLPNNKDWKTLLENHDISRYLFREAMWNYDDIPVLVGGGGFMVRNVYVYSCSNCGNQYHLISLSSFIHRDKSKDGIVEEKLETQDNLLNNNVK